MYVLKWMAGGNRRNRLCYLWGEELLPMQTYTIRVQVKTTDGNHTEAHATFETGRMEPTFEGELDNGYIDH